MARKVTAGHEQLRHSEHEAPRQAEKRKQELNNEYGEPCPECKVRVDREVTDTLGNVEYPAGSHAVGCPEAEPGTYHPQDERAQ